MDARENHLPGRLSFRLVRWFAAVLSAALVGGTVAAGCAFDESPEESDPGSSGAAVQVAQTTWYAPPMRGRGVPLLVSNNPEEFHGDGLLFGTGNTGARRPIDAVTGAYQTLALDRFGIYIHHINKSKIKKYISIFFSNPNNEPVTIRLKGSAYQTDDGTHSWARTNSPSQAVSRDWLEESVNDIKRKPEPECPNSPVRTTGLKEEKFIILPAANQEPVGSNYAVVWQAPLSDGANVDGRFWVNADKPVFAYVVASGSNQTPNVYNASMQDAPGDIRVPGLPANVTLDTDFDAKTTNDKKAVATVTLGREAGVYEFDTAAMELNVMAPGRNQAVGYFLTIDAGEKSVWRELLPSRAIAEQTFAPLMAYPDSAQRSVGMYGTNFDVRALITNPLQSKKTVAVNLVSFGCAASRCYDGWVGITARDDEQILPQGYKRVLTTPESRVFELGRVEVNPGQTKTVRLLTMIPGLSSIPQALTFTDVTGEPAPKVNVCAVK